MNDINIDFYFYFLNKFENLKCELIFFNYIKILCELVLFFAIAHYQSQFVIRIISYPHSNTNTETAATKSISLSFNPIYIYYVQDNSFICGFSLYKSN